jgi:hypothetical protein
MIPVLKQVMTFRALDGAITVNGRLKPVDDILKYVAFQTILEIVVRGFFHENYSHFYSA